MANPTEFGEAGVTLTENLRKARIAQELSIEEAANASGLRGEHLEKIEQGDLGFLPAPFVLSMLREYASALGVQEEELFRELKASVYKDAPKEKQLPEAPAENNRSVSKSTILTAMASLLALMLLFAWLRPSSSPAPPEFDLRNDPAASGKEPREAPHPEAALRAGANEGKPAPLMKLPAKAATKPVADAMPETEEQELPSPAPEVAGAFSTAIDRQQREPRNRLTTIPAGTTTLFYFSDVATPSGETLYHQWLYNGKPVQQIPVGTPTGGRWRSWSSKSMKNVPSGEWMVQVLQGERVIHTDSIETGAVLPE